MRHTLKFFVFSFILLFQISCEESKTTSEELSDILAEKTKLLTEDSYLDDRLLHEDIHTSGILEDPNNYSIGEIHDNYVAVTQKNQNNVGLENYKRFYLSALMDRYNLEQHKNIELLEFYLNEHYTLVNFKNPLAEYKLLKSLQGKINENAFSQYIIKTRARSEDALDSFYALLKDESIINTKEKRSKLNSAIKKYEDLLIKIDNMNV